MAMPLDQDFQISVELDPTNDNVIDVLVLERGTDGLMTAERYRVERTQRRKPGTIQVKLGKAQEAEQPLMQRVRQKVKAHYGGDRER